MARDNRSTIKRSVRKQFVKTLPQATYNDFNSLKEVARTFTRKVETLYKQQVHAEGLINKSSFASGLTIFYHYMKESESFTRQILQQQHYFQYNLDKFLGRTIFFTWVNRKSGEIFFADEVQTGKIYQTSQKMGTPRGSLRSNEVLRIINNFSSNVSTILKTQLQASVHKRKYVFQEACRRYADNHRPKHYWWYDIKDINYKDPIPSKEYSGYGYIAQGYVDAVVNENPKIQAYSLGAALQSSLEQLDRITDAHNVTAGIVKGDVILNKSNGIVQFAVKNNRSFDPAKFGPAFLVASHVLTLTNITAQELERQLDLIVKDSSIDTISKEILMQSYERAQSSLQEMLNKNRQIRI